MSNFLVGLFTGVAIVVFAWWQSIARPDNCWHHYELLGVEVGAKDMASLYRCIECGERVRFHYEGSRVERLVKR